jgi:hypothetical protein
MKECQKCPVGKYSSSRYEDDLLKCPTNNLSPTLNFIYKGYYTSYEGYITRPNPSPTAKCSSLTDKVKVGASSCTTCPLGMPSTKQNGSTSVAQCTRCPQESYYDVSLRRCKTCKRECSSDEYEFTECTDTTDRICRYCSNSNCKQGEYFSGCNSNNPRGCSSCNGKPPFSYYTGAAPNWLNNKEGCPW